MFYYKPPTLPDDDDLWDIFDLGHQKLAAAGYVQYEISGYSKPGYQCQHNLNYWRFGDYLGIGCGSHGKLSFTDGRIIRTTKVTPAWLFSGLSKYGQTLSAYGTCRRG